MTTTAVNTLRADRAALLEIGAQLTDAQWQAGSGCPGWSVKDVVSHLGALYWLATDPAVLPDAAGMPTEQAQDALVAARRPMSAAEVLADYESVSSRGVDVLASLVGQQARAGPGRLRQLSGWPAGQCVLVRPLHAHPGRPVRPAWPAARPTAAVGRRAARSGAGLDRGGPAAAECQPPRRAARHADDHRDRRGGRIIRLGQGEPVARISSDAAAFVRWVTQRGSWAELGVQASGDEAQLAIARALHVF